MQWQRKNKLAKLTSFDEAEVITVTTAQTAPQKPPAQTIGLLFFPVPAVSPAGWPHCPPDNLSHPESGLNLRVYHRPDWLCLKLLTVKEKKCSGQTALWQMRKKCPPDAPFWTLCWFCVFVIMWHWNVLQHHCATFQTGMSPAEMQESFYK